MSNLSHTCIHHQAAPAIAICTECDGDICAACHGTDLRGYCICAGCREKFAPPQTAWEDPQTDFSPATFGSTLWDALKSPRTFFTKVRPTGPAAPAVSFGLISMTVGMLFSNTWKLLFIDAFGEALAELAKEMAASMEMVRASMFLAVPLQVGLAFLLHLGALHMALRIAGARPKLSATARIVGYASAGYILMVLPPIGEFMLGHFMAIMWVFNLQMGALTMHYRLGTWKTLAVVMGTLLIILPLAF
ncbi:hypothetical protein [Bradymonas sediminis]|uniref:Uncharacterized protein n=1 Tax=Bradymonas sediminis TaxID=1548548 RepID=A0A2Z4FI33_9DELT|nr:hypothetical protein [Bradymonas sediminis]AWV88550.1 hypothetical protein DN745_04035 [Bradymonas sediminis]TDP77690.1 hypothetical protein DFR33_101600 [Bradymonas sediminis]